MECLNELKIWYAKHLKNNNANYAWTLTRPYKCKTASEWVRRMSRCSHTHFQPIWLFMSLNWNKIHKKQQQQQPVIIFSVFIAFVWMHFRSMGFLFVIERTFVLCRLDKCFDVLIIHPLHWFAHKFRLIFHFCFFVFFCCCFHILFLHTPYPYAYPYGQWTMEPKKDAKFY